MGRDKALLTWQGEPLLRHGVRVLQAAGAQVFLAAGSQARYAEFGLPVALDRAPGLGPLGGLEAALSHARTHAVDAQRAVLSVLACDMPLAHSAVFDALHQKLGAADACLLRTPDGIQPLYGVYRLRILGAVREALDAGLRRMDSIHPGQIIHYLDAEELPLGADASNWNTPGDVRRASQSHE